MISTLLIPVHKGREKHLRALLKSLADTEKADCYPRKLLIISQDIPDIEQSMRPELKDLAIPFQTAFFPDAKLLSVLRNRGLDLIKTNWIHCLDSDTLLPKNYFIILEKEFKQKKFDIECFQLNFKPTVARSIWADFEARLDWAILSMYIGNDRIYGLNGMNFLARTKTLLDIGGFDESLVAAEDIEIGNRLFKAGIPMAFLPEVFIRHNYPNRLSRLFRRKFWHGRGYARAFLKCPDLFSQKKMPDPVKRFWVKAFFRPLFLWYWLTSWLVFRSGIFYERLKSRGTNFP